MSKKFELLNLRDFEYNLRNFESKEIMPLNYPEKFSSQVINTSLLPAYELAKDTGATFTVISRPGEMTKSTKFIFKLGDDQVEITTPTISDPAREHNMGFFYDRLEEAKRQLGLEQE